MINPLKKIIKAFQDYSEYDYCEISYQLKIEFYKEFLKAFDKEVIKESIEELKGLNIEPLTKAINELYPPSYMELTEIHWRTPL